MLKIFGNIADFQTVGCKGDQQKFVDKKCGKWLKIDAYGYEGMTETIAGYLGKCFEDLNVVDYQCVQIKGLGVGCLSEDFLQGGQLISVYDILLLLYGETEKNFNKKSTKDKILLLVKILSEYSDLSENYVLNSLTKLLYFDYLIANEDRHFGNIALIFKNGEYKFAPIFDCGMGLLSRKIKWGNIPENIALRKIKFEPFGDKQIAILQQLSDYKLKLIQKIDYENIFNYCVNLYAEKDVRRALNVLKIMLERGKNLYE